MNLHEVQANAQTLIAAAAADPTSQLNAVPVILERGSSWVDTLKAALATQGIAILICLPGDVYRSEQSRPGVAILTVNTDLLVCENPISNAATSAGGLNRNILQVIEALWGTLEGKPLSCNSGQFELGPQPLDRISDIGDGYRAVIQIEARILKSSR